MFSQPELLVSRLIFVGLIIEAIEVIHLRLAFGDDGLFSRSTNAIIVAGGARHLRLGATFGASTVIVAVMLTQIFAAGVATTSGLGNTAGIVGAVICLATNGYLRARRPIGGSGAEQLTFIALVSFVAVLLAGGTGKSRLIGDGFLAAQVCLAYLASGISKLVSPVWRNGGAMTGILSTEGYGFPSLVTLLTRYPRLDIAVCWSVILWELGFSVVLVAPKLVMIVFLAVGVLFHLSCAITMGLNRFFWAFCGCYPAVWVTAMNLRY